MEPDITPEQKLIIEQQALKMVEYRRSIRKLIKDWWGLEPQPVKPEYARQWANVERATWAEWEVMKKEVGPEWFGNCKNPKAEEEVRVWSWYDFRKGKHFTWQQNLILMGVEKAVAGQAPLHLSVLSGHGIGKSATCAWVILWYLYCYLGAQVPVTAPTTAQMHDVLWKEISIWITRMPKEYRDLYVWQRDYVRMAYDPESWFARARTSTKENTEAIAGVHADHVCIVVDEASGVPEQVFITAQGALTSGKVLVILISNGTRGIGYFYDSHHKDASSNQCFRFDSEESPIVDPTYVKRMLKKFGRGTENFRIRVSGTFPNDDMMDDSGYVQLIADKKVTVRLATADIPFLGRKILGVDPSGEGTDKATFVLRDRFKAQVIFERSTTNDKELAADILTFIDKFKLNPEDVVVGAFGVGANVAKEVALASAATGHAYEIYSVLEGSRPKDEEEYNWKFFKRHDDEVVNPEDKPDEIEDLYVNIRALMHFRAAKWLAAGGILVDDEVDNSDFKGEMLVLRYKRTLHGNKIQMMSKKEMLKLRIPSPNKADALGLSFLRDIDTNIQYATPTDDDEDTGSSSVDDRFSAL